MKITNDIEDGPPSPEPKVPVPDASPSQEDASQNAATLDWKYHEEEASTKPAVAAANVPSSSTNPSMSRYCGEYELLDELGRGGMGVVYRARHRTLGRLAALKMILSAQFVSGDQIKRFHLEAKAAALLDHPGIVPIFEVGQHAGEHFLAMAYVDGESLWQKVKAQPLEPRAAAKIMREVAEAVDHAHQRGILHRDLKPQNILLANDGHPRVTDFGLAKTMAADSSLTETGEVMGTPSYMPPEQALGNVKDLDVRADVYSLGATLYCLLTGQPPFKAANVMDTIQQVLDKEPVSPRLLVPAIDRDLETICLKCLAKNRNDRYATARELADELQRFLNGEPIRARPLGPVARAWRWCKRKPVVASLAAAVGVAVVSLLLAWLGAQHAQHLRQLTDLKVRFEAGLDKPLLSAEYLEKMDTLVAAIDTLDRTAAEATRTRLNESWGKFVNDSIGRPRLNPEDVRQLEEAIVLLSPRDTATATSLQEKLKKRIGDWQPVFELQGAFDTWATIFPGEHIRVNDGHLERVTKPKFKRRTLTEGGRSKWEDINEPLQVVPSTIRSNGSVRMEVVFEKSWRNATRLGAVLDASERGGYSFLLMSAMRPVQASKASETTKEYIPFAELRGEGEDAELVVYKRDVVIRRQSIAIDKLGTGVLTLRATRERDRLFFQVNELPIVDIFDPFPLTNRAAGFFGIDWPQGGKVARIFTERKALPPNPSPLQQAEDFYEEGRLAEAEALFQEQSRTTTEEEIRREAKCKRGLCLLELGRREEAAEVLEAVMAEPGDRWPVIAGCQLWLLNLRQAKSAQANAVFEHLSSHYRFEQLAALLPSDIREDILEFYFSELHSYERILRFRPERLENVERAARIDRFLSFDGRGSLRQLELSRAYRYVGDNVRALEVAKVVARDFPSDTNSVKHYIRLLRQTGHLTEALAEWNAYFQRNPDQTGDVRPVGSIERARTYAAMQDWKSAEADLDYVLQVITPFEKKAATPFEAENRMTAALMKGFLQEQQGNFDEAQQLWKRAFHQGRGELQSNKTVSGIPIFVIILGSLTGELSADDMKIFMSLVKESDSQNSIANTAVAAVGQPMIERVGREMWRSPRGRIYAAAYAFETLYMTDRVRIPMALAAMTSFQQNVPGDVISPAQDAVLWELANTLADKLMISGELQATQALQLGLTWKGTTGFLGWGGVAPTLPPDLRGPLAYVFGLRFLKINNPQQAAEFFATAEKDAPPNSLLSRCVSQSQMLLKNGHGRLLIDSEWNDPVQVAVRQGEKEVSVVTVKPRTAKPKVPTLTAMLAISSPAAADLATDAEEVFVDLRPGEYEFAIIPPLDGPRLSKTKVTIQAVGYHRITIMR